MKNAFEVRHPIFLPFWRRALVVGCVGAWTVFELIFGSVFWAIFVGACAVYLLRAFFINFDPAEFQEKQD